MPDEVFRALYDNDVRVFALERDGDLEHVDHCPLRKMFLFFVWYDIPGVTFLIGRTYHSKD